MTLVKRVRHYLVNSEYNLQHLQVGETTESSISDKAHAVVSNVKPVKHAKICESRFVQPGQVIGGQVAMGKTRR